MDYPNDMGFAHYLIHDMCSTVRPANLVFTLRILMLSAKVTGSASLAAAPVTFALGASPTGAALID